MADNTQNINTTESRNPFEWGNVVQVFHDGAFGILFFLLLAYVLSRKSLEEAWKSHRELMEELAKATRDNREALDRIADSAKENSETMQRNAESLRRLAKANSRVAEVMAKEVDPVLRKRDVYLHLNSGDLDEEET